MTARGRLRSRRCNTAVDPDSRALPVAGAGSLSAVRRSRRSRWRAATLVALHVGIAAHVTQFLLTGRTVSPVEPSESMYTIELGQLNAGFVFFAAALLATLVFGRFVCGWGCHLVALQDLCGWLMKRMGIRPVPFRSRLLLWAPLVVAAYMFAWPTFRRLVLGGPGRSPFPLTNHLTTTDFWATFPGPVFTVLTFLVCGFAAVYVLGSKGFCTYGCPYGALFVMADRLSPGRIVVDDGCDQCGHCTVTCTSNVRVHEEVRLHGRVVDPGCMKCMDCVSVCPKNALRFAFARPALFDRRFPRDAGHRRHNLGIGEELLVGAVCLGATLAFRGLYDGPPLLLSVCLGGLTAFAALMLWHLARRPSVRVQNLALKGDGRLRPAGRVFAGIALFWLAFTAHSGFVQWHRALGRYHLERTRHTWEELLGGAGTGAAGDAEDAAEAQRHFSIADRWGLLPVVEVKSGLAWGHARAGRYAEAEAALRAALARAPRHPELRARRLQLLVALGRFDEAIDTERQAVGPSGGTVEDQFRLAGLLAEAGRLDEAVGHYRRCLEMGGESAELRYDLGGLYRRLGRLDEAVEQLRAARELAPDDYDTRVELGLAFLARGEPGPALVELRRAVELRPDAPESRLHLQPIIDDLASGTATPPSPGAS